MNAPNFGAVLRDIQECAEEEAARRPKPFYMGHVETRTKGMSYRPASLVDLDCVIGYEYDAGERQTYDHPGAPASMMVCEVWVNGCDITEAISDKHIEHMEDTLIHKIAEEERDHEDAMLQEWHDSMRKEA